MIQTIIPDHRFTIAIKDDKVCQLHWDFYKQNEPRSERMKSIIKILEQAIEIIKNKENEQM